jgi:hypothetical protein
MVLVFTSHAIAALTPVLIAATSTGATATFNEPMDPSSITTGSFALSRLVGIKSIAAGQYHTVALKNDGTVVAWGYNGQTTVPSGLSGVTAIAAGALHTVALKNDGRVVAWGENGYGQTTVPSGLSGVTAIAAGYSHTVALKNDGRVVAWGENGSGQTTVPSGLSGVTAIAAGALHTVALKNDGTVVAWGENGSGQTTVPSGLSGVTAIAAGALHTVALKNDGTVVAWGEGQTTVPVSAYESSISGTVTYNPVTLTATFTPSSALLPNTTYTVTVSGVRSASGERLTNNVAWNFTTPPPATISGTLATSATVGAAYSFMPTSANAASFTYTGTLPPGLTFDTSTGAISGAPTSVGTYSDIVITTTNIAGSVSLPAFTITVALPMPGTLTVAISGTGGGSVHSSPVGISCTSGDTCSPATFQPGTEVELIAVPDRLSTFTSWNGACVGTPCAVTVGSEKSVDATFTLAPKAMIESRGYPSIMAAYTAADATAITTILALEDVLSEGLVNRKNIILKGGYKPGYSGRTGETVVNGPLIAAGGKLTVERVAVR